MVFVAANGMQDPEGEEVGVWKIFKDLGVVLVLPFYTKQLGVIGLQRRHFCSNSKSGVVIHSYSLSVQANEAQNI